MSEKIEKLVRMANQIADFFRPYSEKEAVAGVQEHIRAFWTSRMRRDLEAHVAAGGAGLHPVALKAMTETAKADSPTEKVHEARARPASSRATRDE